MSFLKFLKLFITTKNSSFIIMHDTPVQNGVFEQKHHHFLGTARSFYTLLMFLLVFGERLFLQTVNLIKHTLSVSFDISPFENLYANLKFFEIELRWGSLKSSITISLKSNLYLPQ